MINSRTKGHAFERQIAILLREIYPKARRGYQYREGYDAPDVEETDFHIECKIGKKVNVRKAMTQATLATTRGSKRPPVVISKEDRGEIMVTMYFELFQVLLKGLKNANKA